MNKTLTLGSLFDGSGGFPLGGLLSGITPVWASEIEPFPIRVTTKRMPFIKHYGDISWVDGGEIEPVDIITFGSPCQDMSVAGKRDGLDGSRSNLFYEAIRIVKEMRCATSGKYPRYIVWENVPGAFSSNEGEDFRCVLESVCKVKDETVSVPQCGKWQSVGNIVGNGFSLAWRVLDAQHWGVPQRRKRIYLVADFAGRGAGKILFESEGLSGYSAQSLRSWQRTAGSAKDGIGTASVCLNDHTRSVTAAIVPVLNDQGGQRMDITKGVACTLRAEAHHPPCVIDSAGFCTEHSADSRGIGYEEEKSPTLRAGVVPAAVALENHPTDGRIKIEENNTVQTLTSRMGTGGNNVPLVMKIRSGCEGGGKGPLIQTDKSTTLATNNDQTVFVPQNWDGSQIAPTLTKQNAGGNQRMPDKDNFNCVLQPFGICSKDSNSMKSDNPHSGVYEANTSRTIDSGGGNPSCNQGGIAIVESYSIQGSAIGRKNENGPNGDGINKDVSFTLNTTDKHAVYAMTTGSFMQVEENQSPTLMARDYKDPNAVCYGIGRDTFNQGKNAKYAPSFSEELQPTLVAKGPGAIQSGYTVRRLTPTECARLQGFPDWWCSELETENPSDDDVAFWHEVFETHRKVMGKSTKPKSEKQIVKWLQNPNSDSAEYKLWGNGVALPNVVFVLSGIVWTTQIESIEKP